jgi:hypothetical protein
MSRKRKSGPGKGQGGGGQRHPNSLRNLRPGPAEIGNQRGLVHGARSELLVRDVEAEVRELMDALASSAPVRDPDGSLPAADVVAIEVAARSLKRYRHVSAWCDLHGRFDEKTGAEKSAARYELQGEAALNRALDTLGMSPMARSKLGLNIARSQSFDLAAQWAEEDVIEGEASDG